VLHCLEKWSLTVREEHRLMVFEHIVLRVTSSTKGKEITGGWQKPNGEEPQNVHSSPQIVRVTTSKRTRWAGHVARLRENRRI
jgi:hypothetical protein